MVEGLVAFQFGLRHVRELLSYLLLGLVSLASGLFLAISDKVAIQTIALVAAPHALLFGIAELRLAAHVRRHPEKRRGFLISGLCEVALGVALACTLLVESTCGHALGLRCDFLDCPTRSISFLQTPEFFSLAQWKRLCAERTW